MGRLWWSVRRHDERDRRQTRRQGWTGSSPRVVEPAGELNETPIGGSLGELAIIRLVSSGAVVSAVLVALVQVLPDRIPGY